jgi:hypothetical protein
VDPAIEIGRVARFWNLKPWEFRSLTPENKAELHALYTLEMEIEGYFESEKAKKIDNMHACARQRR